MTRIVVVGAGIAGVPAAYALKSRLSPTDDITVISDKDYFHFVPSNPWVAMGWREYHEVAFPIEPYLREQGIGFIQKGARRIDAANNRIELSDGSSIDYDFAVIATGPEAAFDEVDGWTREHERLHSVVHIEQAIKAQRAYREIVEHAGPVVIAAAPNASVLGPMYECAFLIDEDLRRRGIRHRVPITILTPEPFAGHLGLGNESENRGLLEGALAERGIDCITNARMQRTEAERLHYSTPGDKAHYRDFAFGILWPAFRGVSALRDSPDLTDARGMVEVDEFLRHPRRSNVFALGLCAARAALDEAVPIGPPVSVYSIQNEVETVTRNVLASRDDEPLVSIVPRRAHWLNDMGETGAAYVSAPQIPLRNINWLKQGRWVHEAKVEFEDHFMNGIKLRPKRVGGTGQRLATAVADMQAERTEGIARLSPRRQDRPKPLQVAVPRELCHDLRALAYTLSLPPEDVAARLLQAAVHDARGYLGEELDEEVERMRRRILFEELPENQPGVEFDGGAT